MKNSAPSKNVLVDSFILESKAEWTVLEESAAAPLPKGTIAIVEGPMFAIDGFSENNRFYPRAAWEDCLHHCNEALNSPGLFGTVTHERAVDVNAVLEGVITHKTTKLWVNEEAKQGWGRIEIIDTPGGHRIAEVLRAGMKIPVSTRATGRLLEGKGPNGCDLVEVGTLRLQCLDFVDAPGIAFAVPALKENKKDPTNLKEDKPIMEFEKLLERLTEEKVQNATALSEAVSRIKVLEESNAKLVAESAAYKAAIGEASELTSLKEAVQKLSFSEPFRTELGKNGILESFAQGIKKPLESLVKMLESYGKAGSVEEVEAAIKANTAWTELGEAADVKAALTLLGEYLALKMKPSDIASELVKAKKIREGYKQARIIVASGNLAKKFGADASVVKSMLESGMPAKKVEANLAKLAESKSPTAPKNALKLAPTQKPAAGKKAPITEKLSLAGSIFATLK